MTMAANLNVDPKTNDFIILRQGRSGIEYILGFLKTELAHILLPDCPDIDPYNVVVKQVVKLGNPNELEFWLTNSLPAGDYFIKSCRPPSMSPDSIQFGQAKVPTEGLMSVFFNDDPYYGVGVVAKGEQFAGAVFVTICIPDFLLDSSKRGVLMIQLASTESELCHIVVPQHDRYCLCNHDSFKTGDQVSARLRKWYVENGAKEIIQIINAL
jgi:hypothetical protein